MTNPMLVFFWLSSWPILGCEMTKEVLKQANEAAIRKRGVTHCQCEACKNGNIHDSDCSVHNGNALPVGPCDCSQTFVSSPDLGIVVTVSYQLAVRELAKLVENNFGQMPRNDEWADKVLLVRDTFEAAHNIKEK